MTAAARIEHGGSLREHNQSVPPAAKQQPAVRAASDAGERRVSLLCQVNVGVDAWIGLGGVFVDEQGAVDDVGESAAQEP
jgi:hypothetical protein